MSAGTKTEICQEISKRSLQDPETSFHTPLRNGAAMGGEDAVAAKRNFGLADTSLILFSLVCFVADTVTGEVSLSLEISCPADQLL